MKDIIGFLVLISLCIVFTVFSVQRKSTMNVLKSVEYVRVIAHFDNSIISGTTFAVPTSSVKSQEIRELLEHYDVHKTQAIFHNRYNSLGLLQSPAIKNNNRYFLEGWQLILVEGKSKAEELVCLLKEQKGVKEAFIELPFRAKPSISPNDPYFVNGSQWHLKSTTNPLADIDAEAAWDINRGRNDVIIAVADGGVDYNHPDLDPGNRNRVIAGYDFGDFDSDPMDDLSNNQPESYADHGTRVAGAIGAIANDSTGVAGIMWNCKIMPLKMVSSLSISYPFIGTIFDFSTTAFPSSTAMAIDYAVNNGAHVINMSYGISGLGYTLAVVTQQLSALYDAIANAYENNVVLVAAMGNEYLKGNPIEYPAGFSEVIGVGQTNSSLQRVNTSNTGPNIDVSAPGTYLSTSRNNSYNVLNGTSSATPVVSGVAGLVISQGLARDFNLTNDDVKHILEITADDIDPTGWDEETGYGKVNAYRALHLLDEPNELYHYTSTGGRSVKMQTLDKWELLDGRWGLAPGMYFSVDQYKITKHVTFDVPFCSAPQVWMRERQSKCLDYGNPNDGRPFCIITNVSSTGFDLEYVTYYVRYNLQGQTLNKWVPAAPASTYVAYSAVGEPNLAAIAGPITGPSVVCSSGATFEVSNLPDGVSVSWSASPSYYFTATSGTGPTFLTAWTGGFRKGVGTITATLVTSCDTFNLTKSVWAGTPASPTAITLLPDDGVCRGPAYYYQVGLLHPYPSYVSSWYWDLQPPGVIIGSRTGSSLKFYYPSGTTPGRYSVAVKAVNPCGDSSYHIEYFDVIDCDRQGMVSFNIYPNPVKDVLYVEITANDAVEINPEASTELRIYDTFLSLKKHLTFCGSTVSLNTGDLPQGVYLMQFVTAEDFLRLTDANDAKQLEAIKQRVFWSKFERIL